MEKERIILEALVEHAKRSYRPNEVWRVFYEVKREMRSKRSKRTDKMFLPMIVIGLIFSLLIYGLTR